MTHHTPGAYPGDARPVRAARRTVYRVLGMLLMGAALVLIGLSVADFFRAFNDPSFAAMPTKGWMFFLAMPFFLLGGICLQLGFAGAHAKYLAGEISPALRSVARDVGLRVDDPAEQALGPYCRSCGRQNDADARFCDGCGTSMGS
jgi:hypothetical protein